MFLYKDEDCAIKLSDEITMRIGEDIVGYSAVRIYADDDCYVSFGKGNTIPNKEKLILLANFHKFPYYIEITDQDLIAEIRQFPKEEIKDHILVKTFEFLGTKNLLLQVLAATMDLATYLGKLEGRQEFKNELCDMLNGAERFNEKEIWGHRKEFGDQSER